MHVLKIKSLDRTYKINWELKNASGVNLLVSPSGWGKTHLSDFMMHAWVNPEGRKMPYRVEMQSSKGSLFVLGTPEQSYHLMGLKASIETGQDAIMYYPGKSKRMAHENASYGSSIREACAPISDMRIGMSKSVLVIDDIDFGLDAQNFAEYISIIHREATAKGNQVIGTTSRREIIQYIDPSWAFSSQDGWEVFKNNIELIIQES